MALIGSLVLVAGILGVSNGSKTRDRQLGDGVSLVGTDLPTTITLARFAPVPIGGQTNYSDEFQLGPSGPLNSVAALTLPLLSAAPPRTLLSIVTSPDLDGPWVQLAVSSNGRLSATANITALDYFEVVGAAPPQ